MTALPDSIERCALLGWRMHPSSRHSRAACFKGAADAATHDLDQLAAWAREYPDCNWRVIMEGSGIWALDVDAPGEDHGGDGITAMKSLVAANAPLAPRPMTRSGGGGYAIFFKHQGEPISGRTGTPAPGLDPRRGRLSVTLPPSIHHRTAKPYVWVIAPWDVDPPTAPAWLLDAVKPPPPPPVPAQTERRANTTTVARKALWKAIDKVHGAQSGGRNDTLNRQSYRVARFVAAGLLGETEAQEALYSAGRQIGLTHPEIKATIESAFRSGYQKPVEATWGAQ